MEDELKQLGKSVAQNVISCAIKGIIPDDEDIIDPDEKAGTD